MAQDQEPQCGSLALVTTVWLPTPPHSRHLHALNSFLVYHLQIGVASIDVYFDGPRADQPALSDLATVVQDDVRAGRVRLICSDDTDVLAYDQCHSIAQLQAQLASDVATRQMAHAELTMQRLSQAPAPSRVRWLLHLDLDELLHLEAFEDKHTRPESAHSALDAFVAALDASKVDQLVLRNHEAVPMVLDTSDYFAQVMSFRRHTTQVPLTTQAQQCVEFWRRRTTHEQYFLFYDNGKAVVRVAPDVMPASVHQWRRRQKAGHTAAEFHQVTTFVDPRSSLSRESVVGRSTILSSASVLHYPVCGRQWLMDKYARLGAFPNYWGGTTKQLPMLPCFHREARDAAAISPSALNDLYQSQVMLDARDNATRQEWTQQVSAGVCVEFLFPRKLLEKSWGPYDAIVNEEPKQRGTAKEDHLKNSSEGKARSPLPQSLDKAWLIAGISQQYL